MERRTRKGTGWYSLLAVVAGSLLAATAFAGPLMHTSQDMAGGSTKWGVNGWGVTGGKYGAFTCTTCHNKTTTNIKRVVPSISNHIGYSSASGTAKPVAFRNLSSQGFGDDGVVRATSNMICSVCHTQTAVHKYNNPTATNHQNANRTDCTSCHAHDTGFAASCVTCHANPPTTLAGMVGYPAALTGANGGVIGNHAVHDGLGMACATCHTLVQHQGTAKKMELGFTINQANVPTWGATATNTATANVYPDASMTNGYTWLAPNPSAPLTTITKVGNNNTCNLYCHGSAWGGEAATAATKFANGSVATPNWNNTYVGCNDCHGGTPGGLVPGPALPGAHTRHAAGVISLACASCHGATAVGGAHVDGKVAVNLSGLSGASPAYSGGNTAAPARTAAYGNCSNMYCHSSIQGAGGTAAPTYYPVQWGAANTGCAMCHADAGLNTGSHLKHITANTSTNAYACAACHGSFSSGLVTHANGTINISMATGTYAGDAIPANATGFSNCTVTCHGTAPTPNWGSGPLNTNCSGCHGTRSSGLTVPHAAHLNFPAAGAAFACTDCHANVISNDTTVSAAGKTLHINTFSNVSGAFAPKTQAATGAFTQASAACSTSSCHSNGKGGAAILTTLAWNATTITCGACHGTPGSPALLSGMPTPDALGVNAHVKHLPTADTTKCVLCHDSTVNGTNAIIAGSKHLDKTRNVSFNKINAGFANVSGTYNAANRTCSATYCHGATNATSTNHAWGTLALNCNDCHLSNNTLPGAHGIHYNTATAPTSYTVAPGTSSSSATAYVFACSACHGAVTSAHIVAPAAAGGDATIFFGFSTAGKGQAATTNYIANMPGTGTADSRGFDYTAGGAGRCNTTYCHSNGQAAGNGLSNTVVWTTTTRDASCTTCHGSVATVAGGLSGTHNAHMNNASQGGSYGCVDCHANTSTTNAIIANYSKHVNKLVNYSGALAGPKQEAKAGTVTCTSYCHTTGRGGNAVTGGWNGGALGCASCHANPPTAANDGAHGSHAAAGATNCALCHATTVNTAGSIISAGIHINKQFTLSGSFTVPVQGTTAVATQCSNIVCHNSGTANVQVTWGTQLGCEGCHPYTGLSGAHQVHMGAMTSPATFYNYTGNKTVIGNDTIFKYGFGCANCHPTATTSHFNGAVDVAVNGNYGGTADPTFPQLRRNSQIGASYSFGTKACANTYCHSDGSKAIAPVSTTISWLSTFAAAGGDRCAKCHGNSPATNAHTAHVIGIHNDDVFDGRSGKLPTSGAKTVNAAHGAGNRATTIDCYICHVSVINVAGNDKNTYCVTCHTGAATVGSAKITSLQPHVNGVSNVQFANTKIATKSQLRPGSFDSYTAASQGNWTRNRAYKTYAATFANNTSAYDVTKLTLTGAGATFVGGNCSNIACHAGKPVTWNATPLSCEACHTRL